MGTGPAGWHGPSDFLRRSASAAKPRLAARERSGGAVEGRFGASSAGFVFQSLSRRGGAKGAQRDFHTNRALQGIDPIRNMDQSLRPLCASGGAAPCGKGRSEAANEGRFGASSAGFVFQSLSRRGGARWAQRAVFVNRSFSRSRTSVSQS